MASVTPRTWNKLLIGAAFILIAFGAILIVAYAIYAYTAYPLGKFVRPEMLQSFSEHRWLILQDAISYSLIAARFETGGHAFPGKNAILGNPYGS